jgi:hypothetical protein
MIDIHCHLLPSVDDGASSWDVTLGMCRDQAVRAEIDHSCSYGTCGSRLDGTSVRNIYIADGGVTGRKIERFPAFWIAVLNARTAIFCSSFNQQHDQVSWRRPAPEPSTTLKGK